MADTKRISISTESYDKKVLIHKCIENMKSRLDEL